ncbi:MAG TPA: hypothetical protein VJ911_10870, partial [Cryomorphaceae bacterium]|nr:hypothetical protein [Cryomorphaceae bacterium]
MRWIILLLFSCCISAIEGHSKITERSPALQAAIDSMSKYMDAGNFEEAEKWLNEARVRLGAEPHQKDYFSLRYNEGNFYLKKWQLEAAEPVLLECLQLARKSADSTQLVMANAMMSQLKAEQSLYGASIVYGNEALDYSNSADSLQYYGLT